MIVFITDIGKEIPTTAIHPEQHVLESKREVSFVPLYGHKTNRKQRRNKTGLFLRWS